MARVIARLTLLHVLDMQEVGPQNLEAAHTLLREINLLARLPIRCMLVPSIHETDVPDVGTDGRQRA